MDNGGEFKGAVLQLCRTRNIQPIHSRAYHPQSQGSIEQANKTFKDRLRALQMELGTKSWVHLLPQIAKTINTSHNRALPKGVTPNEVWFGRVDINWSDISEERQKENQRRAQTIPGSQENPLFALSSDDDDEEEEEESNSSREGNGDEDEELHEALVLSALHKRVKENQEIYNQRMIDSKGGVIIKYRKGQVVLLKIPKKMKQNTKAELLPCRVVEVKNKAYVLLTPWGRLKGLHQASQMIECVAPTTFDSVILRQLDQSKPISIAQATQKMNGDRPSISALQKAGRIADKRKALLIPQDDEDHEALDAQWEAELVAGTAREGDESSELGSGSELHLPDTIRCTTPRGKGKERETTVKGKRNKKALAKSSHKRVRFTEEEEEDGVEEQVT